MYATALRVSNARGGAGITAFYHEHGLVLPWPEQPWLLPEQEPRTLVARQLEVPSGGNTIHAYLDILAPDGTLGAEIDVALTSLWLELAADASRLPNPVVRRKGRVTLRFGVEDGMIPNRVAEFSELRRYVDPGKATWVSVDSTVPSRASALG